MATVQRFRALHTSIPLVLGLLLLLPAAKSAASHETPASPANSTTVRAMTWNIWNGGRADGEEAGPQAVIDVIRDSGADLVAMQETYGSGARIASALGFHFQPRGTNVSILSRFPIIEDLSVHEPFMCTGALIEVPGGGRVAFYSLWLPYDAEIWGEGTRDPGDVPAMIAACDASAVALRAITAAIDARLAAPAYAGVPVVIGGDFNAMSHLDYTELARDQHEAVIDWPTSRVMTGAGYLDAYRAVTPHVNRAADRTWTPRFPAQEQDRIDFVHLRGAGIEPVAARVIDQHAAGFPSDHAAVLATLRCTPAVVPRAPAATPAPAPAPAPDPAPDPIDVRALSYNIKHGRGMDGRVDLARVAAVLERQAADLIGLQEVDLGVRRSGGVNQAAELGRRLGMHAAFGSFMDHDGGRYGMAVLSRHPIVGARSVRLPTGNEPRVALAVDVRGPGGSTLTVVNVHFDWVADDGFRFAQATALASFLESCETPYVLLGDFNDQPGSRTIELFRDAAREASKPVADRLTFPSDEPRVEIDFVFVAPADRWRVVRTSVIDEPLASDHRPVLAELRLLPPPPSPPD